MEETWRLWATIEAWWPAVEVLITHRVTNGRTEAANTGIKHIKRTGRGYRNPAHYQALSCSPAPPDARREPIDQAERHGQLRIDPLGGKSRRRTHGDLPCGREGMNSVCALCHAAEKCQSILW